MPAAPQILIVEDDAAMRHMLIQALEGCPVRSVEAGNFEEARCALEAQEFDLVLSDIQLPGSTGFAVLDVARCKGTPVVLMTSLGGSRAAEEARARGVFAFLEKPFDVKRLLDVLGDRFGW